MWEFSFPASGTVIDPGDFEEGCRRRLLVPSAWNSYHDLVNYQGEALARTFIEVSDARPTLLVFEAVSHTVRVFLDGIEMGSHYNGFTPFSVEIPELKAGRHELLLHINCAHHADSTLHVANDYYTYGGITRPCEFQELETPVYLKYLHAATKSCGQGKWEVEVTVTVRNMGLAFEGELYLSLAGQKVVIPALCSTKDEAIIRTTLVCDSISAWSSLTPALYHLRAHLLKDGRIIDDLIERIGFREVRLEGDRILLNGQAIRLAGVNRHEDHGTFCCALPLEAMEKDLDLLAALNANAVRTSHYPNDQRFLDLCDERGILVWEENHARGIGCMKHAPMDHPKFREQCHQVNEEMVLHHFNHPCIIIWGILNECDSYTDLGRSNYEEQFAQIRRLDPSRPVTYGACYDFEADKIDRCQDLTDIASWNRYPGWYRNPDAQEVFEKLFREFDPRGMAGKPFICSEIGAGGLYGYRDPFRRGIWSEEAQAETLRKGVSYLCESPRVSGIFIWQFADCRVDPSWAMGRPRCYNNKGLLDEYRRPKAAFFAVSELFKKWLGSNQSGAPEA